MEKAYVLKLYDQYADHVYRFAYSYLGNGEDAEDIVQDVFLKLLQKDIFIIPEKEKSYLMSMTANACKDLLKSGDVRFKVPFDDVLNTVLGEFMTEQESEVFLVLKSLPEKYRSVIHLHYYEGYTIKEIAKILKISASAVSMRLTRGKNELKNLLQKEEL